MDQPYSFGADLLSKFHTAQEWIQALWLIALMLTVLGIAYLAAQILREALRLHKVESQRGALEGRLLYGIYKNAHGELMLYVHGKTESLSAEDLPPRLKLLQR